jgi:type VI protein secretion system component VasK
MMNWLSVTFSVAANEAQRRVQGFVRSIAFWILGLLMALIAIGWLGAAAYTALKQELGPLAAQLILAGIFIVLTVLCIVMASVSGRARTAPPPPPDRDWEAITGSRQAGLPTVAAAFAFGLARGLFRRRRF